VNKLPSLLISWLQSVIGKKLLSVKGSYHVFNSQKSQLGDEFEFLFEEDKHGKIYGDSDGNSLCFSTDAASEFDMQEHGAVAVFCVSDEPFFKDVVGQKLLSFFAVKPLNETNAIGIQMQFTGNKKLSILNLGDELFVFDEISERLVNEEQLAFIPVA
jgi:hypothetical protein